MARADDESIDTILQLTPVGPERVGGDGICGQEDEGQDGQCAQDCCDSNASIEACVIGWRGHWNRTRRISKCGGAVLCMAQRDA